jgi:hypothetical protein
MALHRDFTLAAALFGGSQVAHAQQAEYAFFYWAAFGGAGLLLLVLIAWFLYVMFRGRSRQDRNRSESRERGVPGRLGE